MATSPGPPPQPPTTSCLLLDKLAAELRNIIYELAFTPADVEEVELSAAAPPSKALLLTCRQIYGEACRIHREAYRSYWRSSRFHIKSKVVSSLLFPGWSAFNVSSTDRDIAEVRKLRVTTPKKSQSYAFDLLDKRGVWKCTMLRRNGLYLETYNSCVTVGRSGVHWETDQDAATAAARLGRLGSDFIPSPVLRQIENLVMSCCIRF